MTKKVSDTPITDSQTKSADRYGDRDVVPAVLCAGFERDLAAARAEIDRIVVTYDPPQEIREALAAKDAKIARLKSEQEILIWNLAGCSTYAMGYSLDTPHDPSDWARPALNDVLKLALRERAERIRAERAEAEARDAKKIMWENGHRAEAAESRNRELEAERDALRDREAELLQSRVAIATNADALLGRAIKAEDENAGLRADLREMALLVLLRHAPADSPYFGNGDGWDGIKWDRMIALARRHAAEPGSYAPNGCGKEEE